MRVGIGGDDEPVAEPDATVPADEPDAGEVPVGELAAAARAGEPDAGEVPVGELAAAAPAGAPDAGQVPVGELDPAVPAGGDVTGGRGAGAKVAGRSGAVGASVRWVGGVPPVSPRWASQAARAGARSSTAQASRWRSIDRCESQQATEQNTRRVRSRLQVDTLHTQ
jgi:hypothetical protein